jgi:hypothetical protein
MPEQERHASALLELAHGARSLGDESRAVAAAERACAIAASRGEEKVREEALQFLQRPRVHARYVRRSPPLTYWAERRVDDFVSDLLVALR